MPRVQSTNDFCRIADLGNEASVEQFFVSRMLAALGYLDEQIAPKTTLSELAVSRGRRKVNFRPDYALKLNGSVRWVLDAKATSESLDDWVGQCASYCLELNRMIEGQPVRYFVLTNGVATRLYQWDLGEPLLELGFDEFKEGNPKYARFRALLEPQAFAPTPARAPTEREGFVTLRSRTVSELNLDFAWAHRYIYRRESLAYGASFMEFVKVIFLKLLSDRRAHASPNASYNEQGELTIPQDELTFSRRWIEQREGDHPNPMDALQFSQLLQQLEAQIQSGQKKRIFSVGEKLLLSNETIKAIAERFESTDLYAIDADLNGRMFETFLNAVLRGKDLGQYFTPRSVVKLATKLARLRASRDHVDVVLDACCGTGGFLIEALSNMWAGLDGNASLTAEERQSLKKRVAEESIFGVDIARDPALARIARINMYLHGDGGSRIYQLDALDKGLRDLDNDSLEIQGEKTEFRTIARPGGFADVVLTNPPFAKEYKRDQEFEDALLDDYDLGFTFGRGARRKVRSLRSSVMFLERYHDYLVDGGRLVTVVDDGILGSRSHAETREWLRRHFVVRAVVSLPGDAFQRSQARVKTSVLVLEKRHSGQTQEQPPVFMYYAKHLGIDDSPRQRVLPIDAIRRREADEEVERISALYEAFLEGSPDAREWTVPADAISDRMDVKAVLPKVGDQIGVWRDAGLEVRALGDLVRPLYAGRSVAEDRADDEVATTESDELVTFLRVRYDGQAEAGDEMFASDSAYSTVFRVREGDLVISHINAIHGAVAVVPVELDGCVVTNEYTVVGPKDGIDVGIVWAMLRTPVARADLLLLSTGIGRTRIDWAQAAQLMLPVPVGDVQEGVLAAIRRARDAQRESAAALKQAQVDVESAGHLASEHAQAVISAFKPPR